MKIGEDLSERLDVVAPKFRVIVTRRPRYACQACRENIVQAPAPARLIAGGIATERLLAGIDVSKYADGLPLYRQEAIFAREKVELRIEIELTVEPVFAPLQDVRAVLLARVGGLFLNVSPQRSRKVHGVARLARTLQSARSRSSSSLIVRSGVSAMSPRRYSRCGSSFERRGFPCFRAARSPLSRALRTQTIAVASPTPKRAATCRADTPDNAASITRSRKSWL